MSEHRTDTAAPDELVEWVVKLWQSLMRIEGVNADTHLFDVPASSLVAVRMRSRIQAEQGKEIDLMDILDHPTPREMAALIERSPEWTGVQPWQQLDWSDPVSDQDNPG